MFFYLITPIHFLHDSMEEEPFNSLYKPDLHNIQSSSLIDCCLLFHVPLRHSKQLIKSCLPIIELYVPGGQGKHSVNSVFISVNFSVYIPIGQSLHFTAFHPDHKLRDVPQTPSATLIKAREIAMSAGLHYVYTGNVHDVTTGSTYCPSCNKVVIERDWYELGDYHIQAGCCGHCGYRLAGHFPDKKGDWGRKRLPVSI